MQRRHVAILHSWWATFGFVGLSLTISNAVAQKTVNVLPKISKKNLKNILTEGEEGGGKRIIALWQSTGFACKRCYVQSLAFPVKRFSDGR